MTPALLRQFIIETLDDEQQKRQKVNHIKSVIDSKKPYLHGQWIKMPRQKSGIECWEATDPVIGKVYLCWDTNTSYGRDRGNSALRDPSKTRHTYRANLSLIPSFWSFESREIFVVNVTGEDDEKLRAKEDAVCKKMMKLFGVDPYEWKRQNNVKS